MKNKENIMSSTKEYKDYILEQLRDVDNISYRPMMGEFLLYKNGILFGGIYDDRLLIKITKIIRNIIWKNLYHILVLKQCI